MNAGTIRLNQPDGRGAGDRADRRIDRDFPRAFLLPLQFGPIPERARHRAWHEPNGVRDIRRDGRIPESQQHGKRDQGSAPDDRIDRARGDAGTEDRQRVEQAHFPNASRRRIR
jgi:hypothetical protein